MTKAEQVAEALGNNGQRFRFPDGKDFYESEACKSADVTDYDGLVRYEWDDGSAICVWHDVAWGIGYQGSDCACITECGHECGGEK